MLIKFNISGSCICDVDSSDPVSKLQEVIKEILESEGIETEIAISSVEVVE